ncbi:MAG: lamin tail domain-containing protein [Candidatus Azambacteria bacterium]|nr:lamin tail domain-containing protein [Candidatus Azambacteria bacterium]
MLNLSIAAIIISEIAWMGTITSPNDEWIELYNNTNSSVNLNNWILKAADDTPKINLAGIIPANSFYLLERTDDATIPNIQADQIYTGALGNPGENLELYNDSGVLIDKVDNSSGWIAGDNSTKQTMERAGHQSWQTSQNPGGTPKEKNSEKETITDPLLEIRSPTEIGSQNIVPLVYPFGIIFSEIMPSPKGADETGEWIEIFNKNNFGTDLSGWQIADTAGKTNIYALPAGTKISAMGFLILSRPETKIILNNDIDGLNLIQPDGKIINSVNYEKAPQGQSYGLINSRWVWSESPTPGTANTLPALTKIAEEIKKEEGLAAISESVAAEQGGRNFYPFLAAFAIAIFSGAIILVLKKN